VVGVTGNPGQTNNVASKAGMIGFSKALAQEIATRNITVNCVAPGFIDDTRSSDGWDVQTRLELPVRVPLGAGRPADVAAAVAFLCSPEAAYITGTTLAVDGGFLADGAYPGTRPWPQPAS
jgi:3-oxoacyl-[acyl-carrier protein] reductase